MSSGDGGGSGLRLKKLGPAAALVSGGFRLWSVFLDGGLFALVACHDGGEQEEEREELPKQQPPPPPPPHAAQHQHLHLHSTSTSTSTSSTTSRRRRSSRSSSSILHTPFSPPSPDYSASYSQNRSNGSCSSYCDLSVTRNYTNPGPVAGVKAGLPPPGLTDPSSLLQASAAYRINDMAAAPFKVKAVFEYSSAHDDDLSFPNGQVITVTEEEGADWYVGEYTDAQGSHHSGLFPKNFVERYEPEIPSRPSRPTRPKSQIQSPPVQQTPFEAADDEEAALPPPAQSKPVPAPAPAPAPIVTAASPRVAQDEPARDEPKSPIVASDTPPKPKPAAAKGPPPPVAGKSNAFKDRIAAFNTGQGAAPMPFKPGGSSANYAIKKPFVAPPPSRNAYVPSPKAEPVHKIYRRDEDPEIAERIAEDQAAAESAGLAVSSQDADSKDPDADEDAPKPQSLKDRIALLQKQQAEQAQRRADAAPKEKPKRPAKTKRSESQEGMGEEPAVDGAERSLPVRASIDSTDQARAAALSPPVPLSPSITREAEIISDGNEADQSAADETTEAAEDTSDAEDLQPIRTLPDSVKAARAPAAPVQEPDVGEEEDTTEGQSEEEEMDAETRRKMELRERMAKISGGMGMAGMFGPQPGMAIVPPTRKPSKPKERRQSEDSPAAAPPRPMIPVPGMMTSPRTEEPRRSIDDQEDEGGADEASEEEVARPPPPPAKETRKSLDDRAPPPIPGDRPTPAVPPATSRPMPPAPPARQPQSPGPTEDAPRRRRSSVETPRGIPPPIPSARPSVDTARSPPPPLVPQSSYFGNDAQSEASMSGDADRRPASRGAPPPVPGVPPIASPQLSRPPPPPPPAAAPPAVEDPDEGESEYEGDYDTDIASGEKHKAALKTHGRQPSLDESTTSEAPIVSSPIMSPTQRPPPPPPGQATRGKTSTDIPRNAPPPVPAGRPPPADAGDDGFDDYRRYHESTRAAPPPPPPTAAPVPVPIVPRMPTQDSSDDLYRVPTKKSIEVPRTAPPLPLEASPKPPDAPRFSTGGGRPSGDVGRTLSRKSTEAPRPSSEGHIASDVDLAEGSQWWTQANTPPPVFQNRNDVLFEIEESSTSRRGGKTTINKEVYVLFFDYSQTVITARFDKADPTDVSLEQRHEPPPPRMRQDQLESAWQHYGSKIAEQANSLTSSKKDAATLGDGSPAALAFELIRQLPSALLPVGTRAYGAPVYANIGNASVQQFDEIRPGDFITFRNARLQGKHGGLHQKYSVDVGSGASGQHVALVQEWDGTKKKVRALEQVRDEKGRVRMRGESYRLADLKSGEVRVWRVVGRDWVGWETGK